MSDPVGLEKQDARCASKGTSGGARHVLVLTPEQLELALSTAVAAASIVSAAPLAERYVMLARYRQF